MPAAFRFGVFTDQASGPAWADYYVVCFDRDLEQFLPVIRQLI